MDFIDYINRAIASIPLGEFYHLYFSLACAFLNLALLVFSITIPCLRRINKSPFILAEVGILFLVLVKAACDTMHSYPPNIIVSPLCLTLLSISLIEYIICLILKYDKNEVSSYEKRLIDRLLTSDDAFEESLLNDTFSKNPFRRVEILSTQKGFTNQENCDFNINPSFIKSYLNKLLDKPLSDNDLKDVQEINTSLEKYYYKNLSDYERDDFSTKLQKLLKLTAKYDTIDFD